MSRFRFSGGADRDIEVISAYLDTLPEAPARKLATLIQRTLESIAARPQMGRLHEQLTAAARTEIRHRVAWPFLVFYAIEPDSPLVLAIIDGRRDVESILRERIRQSL